jgi:hypothetical protein
MKKTTAILLGTALLFTTNAFAAQLLTKSEFKKVASQYKKIGTVNTSNEVSVDDAKKELIEKADKQGADVWCSLQGTPTIKFTVRPISTRKNNVIAATPKGWPFPLFSRQISS